MNEPQNPFEESFGFDAGADPFDDAPDAGAADAAFAVAVDAPDAESTDAADGAFPPEDGMPDLGSEDDAPNPFENPPKAPGETPADNAGTVPQDPQAIQTEFAQTSFYAKPPVFSHASAKEPIEDATQTFDELRAAKSDDFPELEDAARVSWEVSYGKIKRRVAGNDAKQKMITEVKSEIEASKEFAKDLKTSKDKNPTCFVTPRITAQSKGRMAAYKGVFTNPEDARASDRSICFVPGRDGLVHEIRKDETGEYITPAGECGELSDIRDGFTPALPPVPGACLSGILAVFRAFMGKDGDREAIANIHWDRECREYIVHVPRQRVTRTSAHSDLTHAPDPGRYLHCVDVHSHNTMPARFSATDDKDEQATRVYAVLGRLDRRTPEISVRISNGGKHFPIDPKAVFGDLSGVKGVTAA